MASRLGISAILSALLLAAPLPASTQQIQEEVQFAYKTIDWSRVNARAMFEADFRRAAAERNLSFSAAEIAGAAAAAAGGVMSEDSWEQPTFIRGCGPARQFCFVITCEGCRR